MYKLMEWKIFILLMSRFGSWVAEGEDFVIYYKKMVVSHKYSVRGVFSIVAMGKITIAFLVHVAVTRN